ncbi:hypothetical protein GR212_35760 [Rhizobium lusitanum]|uniref:Uncharacterized protein n=1 Tax=Rhizobium lusitanum TaxID=293958 RepID=A0A6L9UKP0_9HYPH|nr:hypothetical protein [Rhizobium lusitanum]NEI74892.1 hypothetical protein [Rhizobium lusitanum]
MALFRSEILLRAGSHIQKVAKAQTQEQATSRSVQQWLPAWSAIEQHSSLFRRP